MREKCRLHTAIIAGRILQLEFSQHSRHSQQRAHCVAYGERDHSQSRAGVNWELGMQGYDVSSTERVVREMKMDSEIMTVQTSPHPRYTSFCSHCVLPDPELLSEQDEETQEYNTGIPPHSWRIRSWGNRKRDMNSGSSRLAMCITIISFIRTSITKRINSGRIEIRDRIMSFKP
jgi:hypothetical protein